MAFYHWAGPAMKATVEGKQKAREDEQNSRMKEIQMQQLLESIANTQQERSFAKTKFGWETEDRPMQQKKLDAELKKMMLSNTGLELGNVEQKLKNQYERGTIQQRMAAEQALNKLKAGQAGIDMGLVESGDYAASQKAKLAQEALQNALVRQQITSSRNVDARAGAAAANESAKKMMNELQVEYMKALQRGDQAEAARLETRIHQANMAFATPSERALMQQRAAQIDKIDNDILTGGKGKGGKGKDGGDSYSNLPKELQNELAKDLVELEKHKQRSWPRAIGRNIPIVGRFVNENTMDELEKAYSNASNRMGEFKVKTGQASAKDVVGMLSPAQTAPIQNRPRKVGVSETPTNLAAATGAQQVEQALGKRLSTAERNMVVRMLNQGMTPEQVAIAMQETMR